MRPRTAGASPRRPQPRACARATICSYAAMMSSAVAAGSPFCRAATRVPMSLMPRARSASARRAARARRGRGGRGRSARGRPAGGGCRRSRGWRQRRAPSWRSRRGASPGCRASDRSRSSSSPAVRDRIADDGDGARRAVRQDVDTVDVVPVIDAHGVGQVRSRRDVARLQVRRRARAGMARHLGRHSLQADRDRDLRERGEVEGEGI